MSSSSNKGFFRSLFDFSFQSLVTPRIIRILYVISLILIVIGFLSMVIGAVLYQSGVSLVALVFLAPIGLFLTIIYVRVVLELIIVIFNISESAQKIAWNTSSPVSGGGRPEKRGTDQPQHPDTPSETE